MRLCSRSTLSSPFGEGRCKNLGLACHGLLARLAPRALLEGNWPKKNISFECKNYAGQSALVCFKL